MVEINDLKIAGQSREESTLTVVTRYETKVLNIGALERSPAEIQKILAAFKKD